MIAKGNSRSNAKFFVKHLLNAQDNERVTVKEIEGFIADNVPDAFKEMEIIAAGSSTKNYMYHLNLSPRPDETLTPEQWTEAVDTAAKELGLENQPRLVIEHEKKGRVHEHIIWLRLDDNLNAISDSWNYQAHDRIREQLEQMFNHEPTPPTPEPALRKSREFAEWEQWRGTESGLDPKLIKAQVTALFQSSDNGAAFASALEESGFVLCRGDKQGVLCIIDSAGDSHALLRRIDGIRAADLRRFMADLDPQTLPSVAEAVKLVKAQPESEGGDSAARILPEESRPAFSLHSVEEFSAAHKKLLLSSPWGLEDEDIFLRRSYALEQARLAAIPDPPSPSIEPALGKWAQQVTDQRQDKDKEPEL